MAASLQELITSVDLMTRWGCSHVSYHERLKRHGIRTVKFGRYNQHPIEDVVKAEEEEMRSRGAAA